MNVVKSLIIVFLFQISLMGQIVKVRYEIDLVNDTKAVMIIVAIDKDNMFGTICGGDLDNKIFLVSVGKMIGGEDKDLETIYESGDKYNSLKEFIGIRNILCEKYPLYSGDIMKGFNKLFETY